MAFVFYCCSLQAGSKKACRKDGVFVAVWCRQWEEIVAGRSYPLSMREKESFIIRPKGRGSERKEGKRGRRWRERAAVGRGTCWLRVATTGGVRVRRRLLIEREPYCVSSWETEVQPHKLL